MPLNTPWQAGSFLGRSRQLLFGAMYEDPAIELEAFAPGSRVFCIAGAGCTARALSAAGHDVTAVDINPEQVAYAQARAAGAPMREGAAERLLSQGRCRCWAGASAVAANFSACATPPPKFNTGGRLWIRRTGVWP